MSMQAEKIGLIRQRLQGGSGDELAIEHVPVSVIADEVGTPFYAYSGGALSDQIRRVSAALGDDVHVIFSVKSNPSLGICQLISGQGVGCEVASIGELILAQKAGFPSNKTLFIGPGKTDEELEEAVRLGIRAVIVESGRELERLAEIACRLGAVANVGIRVNVASQVKGYQMKMGGGAQQFGVDEEALPELLAAFRDRPGVNIEGLHVYAGSQMFDVEALLEHCRYVADLAIEMAGLLERPLGFVDFGGGFGIPYFEKDSEFDLDSFGDGFRGLIDTCKQDNRLAGADFVIELGRYLVAECGVYVTRVLDVKKSREKTFAITDGGMNHHVAATGNFGQVFRKPYPLAVVNKMRAADGEPVSVVGPNCTPLDVFGQNLSLPEIQEGDLIGVFYSGAYGYSASSMGFLSHPTPAEVLVMDGKTYLLRGAGDADHVLNGQHSVIGDGASVLYNAAGAIV